MSSSATAMEADGFIKPNNSEMKVICAFLKHMKSKAEVDWEEVSETAGLEDGTAAKKHFAQVCLKLNLLGAITVPRKSKTSSAAKSESGDHGSVTDEAEAQTSKTTGKVSRNAAEAGHDDSSIPARPSKRARPAPGAFAESSSDEQLSSSEDSASDGDSAAGSIEHQAPKREESVSPVLKSVEYDSFDEPDEPVTPPAVGAALPPHLMPLHSHTFRSRGRSIANSRLRPSALILGDISAAFHLAVAQGVWPRILDISERYQALVYDFAIIGGQSVTDILGYIKSLVESDRLYSGNAAAGNTDAVTATPDNGPRRVHAPVTAVAQPGPTRAGRGTETHSERAAGHPQTVLSPLEHDALAPTGGLQNQLLPRTPLREFAGHNQQDNAAPPSPAAHSPAWWWVNRAAAFNDENADPSEI